MTTDRSVTAPLALSTTQTAGSLPFWKIALSGTSASSSGSGRASVSDAVMPIPMKSGPSTTVKRAGYVRVIGSALGDSSRNLAV
jgi:hypothetical protein